jgi:hypothetical protein
MGPSTNAVFLSDIHQIASVHGFDEPPTDVLIGGGAPESLKQEIETTINGALAGSGMRVRIASPDEGYGGDSPQNIVNRLTAGGGDGIQIEQSLRARTSHWQNIADAVAEVYDSQAYIASPALPGVLLAVLPLAIFKIVTDRIDPLKPIGHGKTASALGADGVVDPDRQIGTS